MTIRMMKIEFESGDVTCVTTEPNGRLVRCRHLIQDDAGSLCRQLRRQLVEDEAGTAQRHQVCLLAELTGEHHDAR